MEKKPKNPATRSSQSDISKTLTVLKQSGARFLKSETNELLEQLRNIVIGPVAHSEDQALFAQIANVVKVSVDGAKKYIKTTKETHKPQIDALATQLDAAKTKLKDLIEPVTELVRELERIDSQARNAINTFATEQFRREEAAKAQAAAEAAKAQAASSPPKFMPKAPDTPKLADTKPQTLTYRTIRKVIVKDLAAVPDNLVVKQVDVDLLRMWLQNNTFMLSDDIEALADGRVKIMIPAGKVPEAALVRTGVKERIILDLNGCAGVEIVEEKSVAVTQ